MTSEQAVRDAAAHDYGVNAMYSECAEELHIGCIAKDGFIAGAAWAEQRGYLRGLEAAAKVAWNAVRNAAERMDHADECALMGDFAESAIKALAGREG